MNVTIGGKCASSPENKDMCPPGKLCQELYEQYPFYIALENSVSFLFIFFMEIAVLLIFLPFVGVEFFADSELL